MSDAVFELPPLPRRPVDAHKGTFGTVVVIGGSSNMIGAPALAAGAALRTGCGLAKILTEPSILPFCLTIEPSATGLAAPLNPVAIDGALSTVRDGAVLAVGPGMGMSDAGQAVIEHLAGGRHPLVLDADGLNNLATLGDRVKKFAAATVLTPHPGEFKRLAAAASIEHDPTDHVGRPRAAAALAQHYGVTVVLKGSNTIVSDGQRFYRNDTGNAALATAGTGDVLTGIIASLLAQGMDPMEASAMGVHLHGFAADMWREMHGPAGLTARDLAELLPDAMEQMERAT